MLYTWDQCHLETVAWMIALAQICREAAGYAHAGVLHLRTRVMKRGTDLFWSSYFLKPYRSAACPKAQPGRYAPGPGGCFLMFAETRQMDAYQASCASRTHPTPSFKNVSIGVIRSASFLKTWQDSCQKGHRQTWTWKYLEWNQVSKDLLFAFFFSLFLHYQGVRPYASTVIQESWYTRIWQSGFPVQKFDCLDSRTL